MENSIAMPIPYLLCSCGAPVTVNRNRDRLLVTCSGCGHEHLRYTARGPVAGGEVDGKPGFVAEMLEARHGEDN